MMVIEDQEFEEMRSLVYRCFGINLTEQKRSLVVGRLQKLLQKSGFSTFRQYLDYLRKDPSLNGLSELVNRISTNYSFFYREKSHFEYFSTTVLPEIVQRQKERHSKDIRIWTAGCSTGEEPYMIVMLMLEHLGREYGGWDAGLLATDISERALEVAKTGIYPLERTTQLPAQLKNKYFSVLDQDRLMVKPQVRKEVTFRRFNLMNQSYPFKKTFQAIFCRNVMIYFDRQTRENLVQKFYEHTEPGGFLFIGHSETLGREQQLYDYIMPATYRRR